MPVSLKELNKCFTYSLWHCWKARGVTTHMIILGKLRHKAVLVTEVLAQPSVLAISKSFSSSQKYYGNRRKKIFHVTRIEAAGT